MSRYVFKMPDLGEGTVSAEVVAWHVKPGDLVQEDQVMCEVMTEKAAVEMPAPVTGRIVSISGQPGDMVAVGSELVVFDTYGEHSVKLPAGDLVLYTSGSLHRVNPVTRGHRTSSFFWTQSMVPDERHREHLFRLDQTIQKVRAKFGESDETVALAGHYHNLLRMWSEI